MNCYVNNPRSGHELPPGLDKDNTLFYPEKSMTTDDMVRSGKPGDLHVVTDCHFLVCLYDRKEVFCFDKENNEWTNPEIQTYGASFSLILQEIWGFNGSISHAVLDGRTTNVMGYNRKLGE